MKSIASDQTLKCSLRACSAMKSIASDQTLKCLLRACSYAAHGCRSITSIWTFTCRHVGRVADLHTQRSRARRILPLWALLSIQCALSFTAWLEFPPGSNGDFVNQKKSTKLARRMALKTQKQSQTLGRVDGAKRRARRRDKAAATSPTANFLKAPAEIIRASPTKVKPLTS